MSKAGKWLFITAGICILLFSVVFFNNGLDKQKGVSQVGVAPQVGYRLPTFHLPMWPNNTDVSVDNFKGKPLFINFWASWCPPCQAESPDLVKAYEKYGDKVQFISINLTSQDSQPNVQAFIEKYAIKYPTLLDKSGNVAQQYEIAAIPTSLFVDSTGIIVQRYTGAISPEALDSYLQRIEGQ